MKDSHSILFDASKKDYQGAGGIVDVIICMKLVINVNGVQVILKAMEVASHSTQEVCL